MAKSKISTDKWVRKLTFADRINEAIQNGEFKLSTTGDKWETRASVHQAKVRYMKKVSTISLIMILSALIVPLLITAYGGSHPLVLVSCGLGGTIAILTFAYLIVLAER